MEQDDSKLTNLIGISIRFGLPTSFIKAEVNAGRIPALRVGRIMIFNVDAVQKALEEIAAKSTTKTPTIKQENGGGGGKSGRKDAAGVR